MRMHTIWLTSYIVETWLGETLILLGFVVYYVLMGFFKNLDAITNGSLSWGKQKSQKSQIFWAEVMFLKFTDRMLGWYDLEKTLGCGFLKKYLFFDFIWFVMCFHKLIWRPTLYLSFWYFFTYSFFIIKYFGLIKK